jgi:hypothetical protein
VKKILSTKPTKTLSFLELCSDIVKYMTEINFQPVFDYIDLKFIQFKEEILVEVRAEMREMKDQIANSVTEQKRFNDELQVANSRIGRLEGWAKPVGGKINIPFQY